MNPTANKRKGLQQRLFNRVLKMRSGCWEWQGYRMPFGYGQIMTDEQKIVTTHRASWFLRNGEWPASDMHVCHKCDNPPCVNPDHLFLGTAQDNNRDKVEKGRQSAPIGEQHPQARLSDAQVAEIRRRHIPYSHPARKTGGSTTELAREFGVTRQYIGDLVKGEWRVKSNG